MTVEVLSFTLELYDHFTFIVIEDHIPASVCQGLQYSPTMEGR